MLTILNYRIPISIRDKKGIKFIISFFVKIFVNNKIAFYLYGWLLSIFIKYSLKYMPILFIEKILISLNKDKNRHIHIVLAQKK